MNMTFPPRQIAILGALVIFSGVSSVVSMLFKWFAEYAYFDLGFVGIVIGYGLLIGRSSSRSWALFFAGLGWLAITGLVVWLIFNTEKAAAQFDLLDWFGLIAIWTGSLYFLIVLKAKRYRDWFESVKEDTSTQKSFAWAVAIVSLVASFSYEIANWHTYETHAQMYPYHVRIAPYDEVTGKGMDQVEHRSSVFSDSSRREFKFPSVGFGTTAGENGMEISIEGIATGPFEYTVYSDGYEEKTITIDRNSPEIMRVPMKRAEKIEK